MAPMFNEGDHIATLVADIAAQDYEGSLELLVADGGSTDGCAEMLVTAAEQTGLELKLFVNSARWVANGLNLCIEHAGGDLVVRVDCHSRYPADYVRRCVMASEETGADNVGGVFLPRGRTQMERAVACAMESPFGGIHWTRHRQNGRVETDTVPYGAYRSGVFDRIGRFDESFVRNQDDELNLRLRLAGGRIVLDPAIRIFYTPRGSFTGVFRQYFQYGRWKPAVMRKHRRVASSRSLAPSAFVGSIFILALAIPWLGVARFALAGEVAVYLVCALAFGTLAVRRRRESWKVLPRVVATFPTFHVAYGVGTLLGWARPSPTP